MKQPENAEASASFSFDDTPLARELADLTARRRALESAESSSSGRTRVLTVSNQKGGVGKTTTDRQHRGGAGRSRRASARDRPRSAGQRLDRARGAAHRGHPERLRRADRRLPDRRHRPDQPGVAEPAVRAEHDPPRGRRDRAGLAGRARAPAAHRARRLPRQRSRSASTSSSSTARRRSACSRSTPSPPRSEVLIPIQCEYYALEGLSQLLSTVRMIQKHLNPRLRLSTILLTMYDGRTSLAQQVAEEVREHFPNEVLTTVIPRSVRVSEAPSFGQTRHRLRWAIGRRDRVSRGRGRDHPARQRIRERRGDPDGQAHRPGPGDRRLIPTSETTRRRDPSTCSSPASLTADRDGRRRRRAVGRARRGARCAARPHRSARHRARTRGSRARTSTPDDLAELVHSVREFGVLQPVVVRATSVTARTSSSWASAARAPRARPASTRSPPSSATPPTSTCCATPCSRTCTAPS